MKGYLILAVQQQKICKRFYLRVRVIIRKNETGIHVPGGHGVCWSRNWSFSNPTDGLSFMFMRAWLCRVTESSSWGMETRCIKVKQRWGKKEEAKSNLFSSWWHVCESLLSSFIYKSDRQTHIHCTHSYMHASSLSQFLSWYSMAAFKLNASMRAVSCSSYKRRRRKRRRRRRRSREGGRGGEGRGEGREGVEEEKGMRRRRRRKRRRRRRRRRRRKRRRRMRRRSKWDTH